MRATGGKISSERQEDLDFSTRFVSFYLLGYLQYEPNMDTFMVKGTEAIPTDKLKQDQIVNDLIKAMGLAIDIFGEDASRKRAPWEDRRNRIAEPLFEVISVSFAKLTNAELMVVNANKEEFNDMFRKQFKDDLFLTAITTGTASKDSVITRHKEFRKLIDAFVI